MHSPPGGTHPLIAGLLLAAGEARRMGTQKLLLPMRGRPMVRWAAGALLEAGLAPVVVVVGSEAGRVREALSGLAVETVVNPAHASGQASSLRVGLEALPPGCGAVAVALGDMPRLAAVTVRRLVDAFRSGGKGIVLPVHEGRRGHPVLFALRSYRTELLALTGDQGGRSVVAGHPEDVLEVSVEDPGVILDVDTPEAYERWRDAAAFEPD